MSTCPGWVTTTSAARRRLGRLRLAHVPLSRFCLAQVPRFPVPGRYDSRTRVYADRRTKEGLSKPEISRRRGRYWLSSCARRSTDVASIAGGVK